MPDQISPEAIEIADQLRSAVLRLNRLLRRETQTLAISPLLVMLLSTIEKEPGIGVNDLANRENMRAPTMSSHIKALEASALILRDQNLHADKRRVGLTITPEGVQLLKTVRRLRTDWLAKRVSALSTEARSALGNALEALHLLGD